MQHTLRQQVADTCRIDPNPVHDVDQIDGSGNL